jgi:hypothetical protein
VKVLTPLIAQNVVRPALNSRIIVLARVLFKTRALGWALRVLLNWLQRHMCVSDLVAGTLTELLRRTSGRGGKDRASS